MQNSTKNRLTAPLSIMALAIGLSLAANAQTLQHRYSFGDPSGSTTFNDSVGGATWAGTLNNSAGGTPALTGSSLVLSGQGDFAQLPAGVTSNYTQITVEVWADYSASNPYWTRVFSFGDQTGNGAKNSGIDYCHYAGGNYQNLDFLSTNGVDASANNNPGLNGATNAHVTVIVDPVNNVLGYYNGTTFISAQHGTVPPLAQINDTYNLIGRSLYDVDPTIAATFHEFRIYQGALSASTVALNDAAGPGTYLTTPGTISSMNFSTPVNPITVNQSVQQSLTGNFAQVTNLNLVLYGGVTYTSGNTNVLTVTSNGLVKGVAVGTTTVTATYGSRSATNTLTVVSVPTAITHRYSFSSDASDSVGGANGTFMGDASVSGGALVLDGSGYLSLPGNLINIATNAAVTIEAWTTIGATPEWSHLFEFGAAGVSNIYSAPRADAGGFHEFAVSEGGGFVNGQTLNWAHGWSNITLHLTVVIDPTTSTLAAYTNGVLLLASYSAGAPLTYISTNLANIGYSSYGDPNAILTVDEFRIYNGSLTPAQVAMSDLSGPNSTNFNPGTLSSISVVATNYPAFSSLVAPVIFANYASLSGFNLLPNVYSAENGLTVTSSDTNIVSVGANNMLTTYRPGTVTLSATYQGKSSSATVRVGNQAVLTHRYSFTTDASDSVGGANGTLVGTANVSSGQVQLDGGSGDYVNLPGGLLSTYRSATMDIWATINAGQGPWARLFEFADVGPATANEVYFSPNWSSSGNFLSDGVPTGGGNIFQSLQIIGQTVHITCLLGDGTMELYTNGVFYESFGITAPASQSGIVGSWIGYSPYGDPGINGSVNEYRIYKGRLSAEEIKASDIIGPDQTLATTNVTLSATPASVSIILSWPVAAAGFAVQSETSLSQPSTWTTLTNAPTLVGSRWQLTLPDSGTSRFFRLVR